MSASLRFLALAVVGWAAVRAATLGALPGSEVFTLGRSEAAPDALAASDIPAIVPTEFPAIEPLGMETTQPVVEPAAAMPPPWMYAAAPAASRVPIYYYPASVPRGAAPAEAWLPAHRRSRLTEIAPEPAAVFYSPIPQLDDWPLSRIASAAMPSRRSTTTAGQQSLSQPALQARLDRLQLSAWALLRGQPGPAGLATGGTLGGSQAGARLTYNFSPLLAATLRSSSPVGGARGGEVAAGVKVTPFRSIPVSLTAERRQAIGSTGGGRSAFAMFLEGGLYQRPIAWGFNLDAYAQGGVVGIRSRDLFADGGFTLTRPLYGRFSAGFGMWGGVQPGLYRVDAGPRVSMKVRNNMRVHLDWRQRVAGNAEPGSGPAVTLAADF
ncbi:hypothetical protein [Sphingomonas sp.]|uniref:hypothetical protein n=1 Tax=Sphingomonas sp. TaxID=28214 RepID=UPI00178E1F1E|nr:hypothetical protein [Sphingomonas sp.]MBA3511096.1 hypothetical protein [Sphingomonas sp.]